MDIVFHFESGVPAGAVAHELIKAAVGLQGGSLGVNGPGAPATQPGAGQPPTAPSPAEGKGTDPKDELELDDGPAPSQPARRGRPPKIAAVPAPTDEEEDAATDADENAEDESAGDDDLDLDGDSEEVAAKPAPAVAKVKEKVKDPVADRKAVNNAIIAFAQKHGKPAAKKLLARWDATSIADLDPDAYGEVIKAARK